MRDPVNFYLASGLDNIDLASKTIAALCDREFRCTYNWTDHGRVEPEKQAEVAASELAGVKAADALIVLLPGGRGTHIEMGIACALGKPVFLVAKIRSEASSCAFYQLPNVKLILRGPFAGPLEIAELIRQALQSVAPNGLERLVKRSFEMAESKGWWPEIDQARIPEKLALIHSEVSEALEAWRNGDCITEISEGEDGKPEGFAVELADTLIRIFGLAGAYGVPISEALERKHAYNATRPMRHGGKRA